MTKRKVHQPNAQERLELFAAKHWGKRKQYFNTAKDTTVAALDTGSDLLDKNKHLVGGGLLTVFGLEALEAAETIADAEVAEAQANITFAEAMANRR